VIILIVEDRSYAAALAALGLCRERAQAVALNECTDRFSDALEDFERAYVRAMESLREQDAPALLRRQAE
jgi:hypothetical protein